MVLTGLGVTGKHNGASVGGGQFHIEHLDGRHFGEHLGRGQSRSHRVESTFQGDPQRVSKEADKDVRLDAIISLMMDGADGKVVLDFLEDLLDLSELQVKAPELLGVLGTEGAAQQIAAFAAIGLAVFF